MWIWRTCLEFIKTRTNSNKSANKMTFPFLPGEMKSKLQYCPVLKKQARKTVIKELSFRYLPTNSPAALGIGVALQGRKRGLSAVLGRAGMLTNKACSISPPAHWRTQVYQFVDIYHVNQIGFYKLISELRTSAANWSLQRFDSLSNWLKFECWKCHYDPKTKMMQENMHANK